MSQANVYTSVSSQAWYTDKCRISTSDTAVTFQVNSIYPNVGNIYSAPVQIPARWVKDVFVGVGNQLTITGNSYTAQEVGTASSGKVAVTQPLAQIYIV